MPHSIPDSWQGAPAAPALASQERGCNLLSWEMRSRGNGSGRRGHRAWPNAYRKEPDYMTLQFLDDLPSPPDSLTYGPMNYDVLIHPEVLEELELKSGSYPPQLRKNVSVALQCLAVRGYTNIVKGISNGTNRGWRRSPLGGGSNGMHYYLWWALSSTAACLPNGARKVMTGPS